MAISGTPLFSIYFFDTFHRYNFSIYFFDIIFRYFECSQFSEKQKLSLKNYSSSSSLKAKKAEKPPRTDNNDMPAAKGTGGRLVRIHLKAWIKEAKENKNFEERKKLKGLQMDLS